MDSKESLFYMMNAADEFNADAPDGAWQAIIEECVTRWNEEHGTSYDENDTFHEWLQWQGGKLLIAHCGRTKSTKGRPFTRQSLAQHERDCRKCNPADDIISELGLEMTDLVAGDEENDGVYWAMAWELGEW